MKKNLHEFFFEKIYNYATMTKKKKNMKYLQFDFLRLMNTKFHGNFHRVIRGLKGKTIGLNAVLQDHTPQLFLLTETQLRSNIAPQIQGYTFYGKTREGKIGGGVGIYARHDIIPYLTCHISERNLEIIWVRSKETSPL